MTPAKIEKHMPIRLETAANIAFPDGSVTVSALRKQIKAGRLMAWEVGGKYLTSLNEIERMLEPCRVTPSHPDFGTESQDALRRPAAPKKVSGLSSTADANLALGAAKATARALKERLRNSSLQVTSFPEVVPKIATANKATGRIDRLLDWWGTMMLDEVNGAACRQFTSTKGNGAARRELQDLQAAINHHHREGLHREIVLVTLPKASEARQRWLTRQEAAKLIRICLHTAEIQDGQQTDKRPLRHLARFILFALYTGSRPGDIFTASFKAAANRSVIDLDYGLFYRKPTGKRATNKRQPTTPLPRRLIAHLKRWRQMNAEYVVEFDGQPVKSIKTAFTHLLDIAQLPAGIVPYTLRHTCATWKKQEGVPSWEVAGFIGTSEAMVEKHYGHHDPVHLKNAAEVGTQRSPSDKQRREREKTVRPKTEILRNSNR